MQYTLDRYRSICSAKKCPLEITADDYFVTSNGAVYDAIEAAYIVLQIMDYERVSCLPSIIILPASVWLPNCMFVHVSECASVHQEMHRHVLHFILYLTFTASLYDGKYACFHIRVVRPISRLINGIVRQMGASN